MGIFKKQLIITEFKGSYQNRYEYANDSIFDLIRYSKQIKFSLNIISKHLLGFFWG